MIDGYMNIKEASERWCISTRRIQVLCTEGRIEGVAKLGIEWAIPQNAENLLIIALLLADTLTGEKRNRKNLLRR